MAAIALSVVKADLRSGGQSGTVIAEHIWDDGVVWVVVFQAADGENLATRLAAMVNHSHATRKENEIARNVANVLSEGSLAVPTFVMSTGMENFAALRTMYLTATRTEAIMAGDFLSSLTNGQLQTAFSMTAGQVTTLRSTKLTPAASLATPIRNSTGA